MKYGFIGTGNMGGSLAKALAKRVDGGDILLANRSIHKAEALAALLGAVVSSNEEIAAVCDWVFLGVKPQMMGALLQSLGPSLAARRQPPLLISMAAGLSTGDIEEMAGSSCPVLRILPNTPCAVGAGMTLYAPNELVTEAQLAAFLEAMSASGELDSLPEALIDAGSAITGCGGAFADLFLEGLADGGVYCGLPRDKARRYAAQMLLGAARLALCEGAHTGELKDTVCSPGGTTIAGIRALEARAFRSAAMEAVIAVEERTAHLKK